MLFSDINLIIPMTIMFCSSKHPIMATIFLMLITLNMATYISQVTKTSWVSIIIMLLMLGGILILFIYVASLNSNSSFLFHKILYFMPIVLIFPYFNLTNTPLTHNNLSNLFSLSEINNICGMIYLLITLLVVMEMITTMKAPLRSTTY
uniref:NADH dehydrogenase subunit 6 n=1 Tax=Stylochyrus rarior TaxID=679428 RepID=D0UY40_STYRA|nr:NADH dehydrogenase subunit 6 [Stylochyrus rarior]ACY35984.1 NADH dehydrogenase subunit 6 [Stylochyrus rarior]